MGHELHYEAYVCGVESDDIDRTIEDNKDIKKRIEDEILATMLMDPSKIRARRRKKSKDEYDGSDGDTDYLNNAQYILRLWYELKEQWEESMYRLMRCEDALECVKHSHREIDVCPDCKCEIEWVKEEVKRNDEIGLGYTYHQDVYKCPKCGKKYKYDDGCQADGEEKLQVPMKVEVRTWSEG